MSDVLTESSPEQLAVADDVEVTASVAGALVDEACAAKLHDKSTTSDEDAATAHVDACDEV